MKIGGIVAEYNPFHKGHAYQIQKSREILGEDAGMICVMSGDFVQRGEPAVFSKYARAEAAVRCGADLVLELPVQYSIGSAERFAAGAVGILHGLGIVDTLVFGSESGDVDAVVKSAEATTHPFYDEYLREELAKGGSYPTARAAAIRRITGSDIVSRPNDNLGVEYVRALRRLGSKITPMTVKRQGAMHDMPSDDEMKSGSELRSIIHSGAGFEGLVPIGAYEIYAREIMQGRGPVSMSAIEQGTLARLRMLPMDAFTRLPDSAEGLEHKLYRACRMEATLQDVYDSVKSKRYTHARIRRMTLCAALGITREDYRQDNLYGRVLALNIRGRRLLRMTDGVGSIPLISKPAVARTLNEECFRAFVLTADAHDLYVLGYPHVSQRMGEMDWRTSPVYIGEPLL